MASRILTPRARLSLSHFFKPKLEPMNVFLLPLEITKNIEKTLSNYWWKTSQTNNSRLNWMSWERMTNHKSAGDMGFRDFRDFNLAMLGKQGWRFMSNPNSLVTRLYKARYFTNNDFLNSELGHSPNFIWRSICEAKNLVVDGVRWRIGTGENINILNQPWLSNNDNPYVSEDSTSVWAKLWRIRAPPKTINVVWRAISNCLPTLVQLHSKRVQVQTECPVCHEDNETILHSLVTCSFAQQCWLVFKIDIQGMVFSDFGTWLEGVLNAANLKERAEITTLCWAIWRNRNDLVWNQRSSSVNKTVAAAKQYLTQWSIAQSRSFTALLQPIFEGDGDCIWVNPQSNSVKVSVDAAVFEDKDAAGFGLVARDSEGVLLQAKASVHTGSVTPVLAEAMAVKETLSWIDKMKWPNVILVSDCLVVIQAIRSTTPMRSQFGSIIEECRSYLRRLNTIVLYHVKRSANRTVHQLARESYNYSGRSFDRDSIPLSVKHCIELDLIG